VGVTAEGAPSAGFIEGIEESIIDWYEIDYVLSANTLGIGKQYIINPLPIHH
jgi:hypothetical protein